MNKVAVAFRRPLVLIETPAVINYRTLINQFLVVPEIV